LLDWYIGKKELNMRLIKTASGKKTVKISKSEWQSIGKTAGWYDEGNGYDDRVMDQEPKEQSKVKCPKCGRDDAKKRYSPDVANPGITGLCSCGHKWKEPMDVPI
jgi:DNA-directed RNA polymerase subunit M/transcription elongation factor TFIIS